MGMRKRAWEGGGTEPVVGVGGRAHGDGVGGVGRRLSPWLGWGCCIGGGSVGWGAEPGAGALGIKDPSPLGRGCVPQAGALWGQCGTTRTPHCQTHRSSGERDLGAQSSCLRGGVAESLTPHTCARSDCSAPPSSASTPSPGCSSASLPGTDRLPAISSPFRGAVPHCSPPSGLTPSRSHWKSSTLVLGGFLSWTLTASTVLSSPAEHPCTLPSGKASSSSWKGENGVRSPPTRMARKGLKGCKWDWGDRALGCEV